MGLHHLLSKIKRRAGYEKPLNPHLFRHSRATHLAKSLTEYEMCLFFGWKVGSKAPRRYVHLAGRDLTPKILSISGKGEIKEELSVDLTLQPVRCIRCGYENPIGSLYCGRCGLILDEEQARVEVEKERYMRELVDFLSQPKVRERFLQFLQELRNA